MRFLSVVPVVIVLLMPRWSAAAEMRAVTFPTKTWRRMAPAAVGLDSSKLELARDYALGGGGSGYITRRGILVMAWGDPRRRYDLKSSTKSIGVTALGLAISDGKMRLSERARKHHPTLGVPPEENSQTGWLDKITIGHLARQTAGFEKPGGYHKLLVEPCSKWHYSDGGPNWLAECVTLAYHRDLRELMFERVLEPLGIGPEDLSWRNNAYRRHDIKGVARREFGSGISANVDAMARIGYLYLRSPQLRRNRPQTRPRRGRSARAGPQAARQRLGSLRAVVVEQRRRHAR